MHAVAGDAQLDLDRAAGDAGVPDGVGDELGGQQAHVLRRAVPELAGQRGERGGDVARGVPGRRRSDRRPAAAVVTCTARQAMSSRGLPPASATAVDSRCSTTARGPSAARSTTSAVSSSSLSSRRGAAASLTPSV